MNQPLFLLLFACLTAGPTLSAAAPEVVKADEAAIAARISPSLVRVEYLLQSDKGEQPRGAGWGERCPNCGEVHVSSLEEYIKEERPVETAGFVLAPDRVIAEDIQTHARFIKSIVVRKGNQTVSARPAAYGLGQNAVVLELSEPLTDARPLEFDPDQSGPFWTVQYSYLNGDWSIHISPLGATVTRPEHGEPFIAVPSACAIVGRDGIPAGMSLREELPVDSSWKGTPLEWPLLSADDLAAHLAALEERAAGSVLRVALSFRSPKTVPGARNRFLRDPEREENVTERNEIGLALGGDRVLVLSDLKPKTTARLERIRVYAPGGEPLAATFLCSLKDYGAFLATLERPLPEGLSLPGDDIRTFRNQLLLSAEVTVQGEQLVSYFVHNRIAGFKPGWRRQIHPELAGDTENLFLFDRPGSLVALPVSRREKGVSNPYDSGRPESRLTAAAQLLPVITQFELHADKANVPLSEEEQDRLAWMGVELQALNKELARINQVSDQTQDGETGALVTFVYPGSPAAQAGIEPGYILLRLRTADLPNPLEVKLYEDGLYQETFPWDRLDEVPDRYFDQIPTPWPPAENSFTRQLTDLGLGSRYVAEFMHNGQSVSKAFEVVASPANYNSAPRHKSEVLGLTVRDLSYEVRRYLQRREDEPGVVISKVEAGGKAAVAGVKPYEMITHINDRPVNNVKDFEQLAGEPGELKLAVKRMAAGRLVSIKAAVAGN